MVVHYPRTLWKNSYAEHEVTGKTYNLKKKKKVPYNVHFKEFFSKLKRHMLTQCSELFGRVLHCKEEIRYSEKENKKTAGKLTK